MYEIEGIFEKGILKYGMSKDLKKNEIYIGEFKRVNISIEVPIPHGNGKTTFSNGDEYFGCFKDGMFHGSGTYKWGKGKSYGDEYIGGFEKNKMHGIGIYTRNDKCELTGVVDKGIWSNSVFSGRSTGIFDGIPFEIEIKNNKLNGESVYFSKKIYLYCLYKENALRGTMISTPEGKIINDWVYYDNDDSKLFHEFVTSYEKELAPCMLIAKNWAKGVAYLSFDND